MRRWSLETRRSRRLVVGSFGLGYAGSGGRVLSNARPLGNREGPLLSTIERPVPIVPRSLAERALWAEPGQSFGRRGPSRSAPVDRGGGDESGGRFVSAGRRTSSTSRTWIVEQPDRRCTTPPADGFGAKGAELVVNSPRMKVVLRGGYAPHGLSTVTGSPTPRFLQDESAIRPSRRDASKGACTRRPADTTSIWIRPFLVETTPRADGDSSKRGCAGRIRGPSAATK